MEDELMTTHQAAAELRITRQRVLQMAKAGRLGRKVEGLMPYYIFTRTEIEEFKKTTRPAGRPSSKSVGLLTYQTTALSSR